MCGIFGITGATHNAAQVVLDGLKKLEYRGYDSWGIVVKDGAHLVVDKHTGKIAAAKPKLPSSHLGLGHPRWAPPRRVPVANAHPFIDCTKKLSLVHNGI